MGHTKCACPSHKSPEKVQAVLKAPRPCNVAEVRLFPVLVNYYYRLNQLLENNSLWKWTERCETAFHNPKEMITSEQILTHYDPILPRRLPCDACPVGIGAVLSHVIKDRDTHCICFQDTHKTEKKLSPLDRLLAVKIYLPSTQERSSNYSSQASVLCIIHGWLRPLVRVQEY